MMDERLARMALCSVASMGKPSLARAVMTDGPEATWDALLRSGEANMLSRRAQEIVPEEIWEATERCGARFVIPGDEEWPEALDDLAAAEVSGQAGVPFGLWIKGLPLPSKDRSVAIVGARSATKYGAHVAHELAADLAANGYVIVSGLAYGIDAAAHQGALLAGDTGTTVAVVASGLDNPYPASNAVLAASIGRRGTLVSELPPGHRPRREAFLARNRIVAGLSGGLCVVEAALRSGAKNSAAWANELGRTVMAVPGQITATTSATPHRLIREGAAVLVSSSLEVRELLEPIGSTPVTPSRGAPLPFDRLPEELQELREGLPVGRSITAGELARIVGVSMPACLAGLGALAESGWVVQGDDGGWELPSSAPLCG